MLLRRRSFMSALAAAPVAAIIPTDGCKHARHTGCVSGQFITVYCADCGDPLYDPRSWPDSKLTVVDPMDMMPADHAVPRIPKER